MGKNQEKEKKTMNNFIIDKSNTLGRKPSAVAFEILPLYKKAEKDDLDAIFDLSRYFFNFETDTGHLQSALYYKSLLIENYPTDNDRYPAAVTMTDIAHIFGLQGKLGKAREWFVQTYKYVFDNYAAEDRRDILEEIGFSISLEAFGLELRYIIMN